MSYTAGYLLDKKPPAGQDLPTEKPSKINFNNKNSITHRLFRTLYIPTDQKRQKQKKTHEYRTHEKAKQSTGQNRASRTTFAGKERDSPAQLNNWTFLRVRVLSDRNGTQKERWYVHFPRSQIIALHPEKPHFKL